MRAKKITNEMAIAAARELANFAEERGIDENNILPSMDEWQVFPRVATATAAMAQRQGLARVSQTQDEVHKKAEQTIRGVRKAVQVLMENEVIRTIPMVSDSASIYSDSSSKVFKRSETA